MAAINILEKFNSVNSYWNPRIICEFNGQYVKLAKLKGEIIWHSHEHEDEFFQVIQGEIIIHLRDRDVELKAGECFVVPKGVEHRPEAKFDALVLLIEPVDTLHTGNAQSSMTVDIKDQFWI